MGSQDNLSAHDQNLSRGMRPYQAPQLLGSRSG